MREYWIVDPETKTIAQMILRDNRYELRELIEADTLKSDVLAGLEMSVSALVSDK